MTSPSLLSLRVNESSADEIMSKLVGRFVREAVSSMATRAWQYPPFRKKDSTTRHEDSLGFS